MSEHQPPRSGSRWEPGAGRPPAYQAGPSQPVAAATATAEPGPPGTATAADPPTSVPGRRNRFVRWRGWADRSRRRAAAAAVLGLLLGGIGGFVVGHVAADDGSGRLDDIPAVGDGDGDDRFPDDVNPDGHRAPPDLRDGQLSGLLPPGADGSVEPPEGQGGTAT